MRSEPGAPQSRGFASLITLVSDVPKALAALEQAAAPKPQPPAPPVQFPPVQPAQPQPARDESRPRGPSGFASLITLVSDVPKALAELEKATAPQPPAPPVQPPRPQPGRSQPGAAPLRTVDRRVRSAERSSQSFKETPSWEYVIIVLAAVTLVGLLLSRCSGG